MASDTDRTRRRAPKSSDALAVAADALTLAAPLAEEVPGTAIVGDAGDTAVRATDASVLADTDVTYRAALDWLAAERSWAKGATSHRNHEGVARQFAALHGKTLDDRIGDDLAPEHYGTRRDAFLGRPRKKSSGGPSKGTLANERSIVDQIRTAAYHLAHGVTVAPADDPKLATAAPLRDTPSGRTLGRTRVGVPLTAPTEFSRRLAPLVDRWCAAHGTTLQGLARAVNARLGRPATKVAASTLSGKITTWLARASDFPFGVDPSSVSADVVDALEDELRTANPTLRPGTLRRYIVRNRGMVVAPARPGREGITPPAPTRLSLPRYALAIAQWPTAVRERWDEFARFKAAPVPPSGMDRFGAWTPDASGDNATATKNRLTAELYFGYLTLSTDAGQAAPYAPGLGMAPEALTFDLLVDAALVEKFIDWYIARNGYTLSVNDPVVLQQTLTRPDTGWLWQVADRDVAPALAGRARTAAVAKRRAWLEGQRATVGACIQRIRKSGQIKTKRSIDLPTVRELLAHPMPLQVVFDMLRRAELDAPSALLPENDADRLDFEAAKFTLVAAVAFPLRRGTWRHLVFGEHLFRRGTEWRMDVPPELFKNRRFLTKPWRVGAAEWARPFFDHYADHVLPHLWGRRQGSPYVLVRSHCGGTEEDAVARKTRGQSVMSAEAVGLRIRNFARRYLGVSLGIHSLRHFAATQYLKDNPKDYVGVAWLLNDDLKTVMDTYAHLEAEDFYGAYNESAGRAFAASEASAGKRAATGVVKSAAKRGAKGLSKSLTTTISQSLAKSHAEAA